MARELPTIETGSEFFYFPSAARNFFVCGSGGEFWGALYADFLSMDVIEVKNAPN